jgi:hypothetical protein
MSKIDKIIQFHIDNNLTTISRKYGGELTDDERLEINEAIKLNSKLSKIRVSKGFGRNSLDSVLRDLNAANKPKKGLFRFSYFSAVSVSMAALLLVITLGGIGVFKNGSQRTDSTSSINLSSISADGSVDSLNKLNLADVQAEQTQIQSDNKSDNAIKVDLASTSKISEAINENF